MLAIGQVNASRKQINFLKGTIEQLRKERAMQGIVDGSGDEVAEEDPEEERAKTQVSGTDTTTTHRASRDPSSSTPMYPRN
jgi:hypothetical protein